MLISVMSRMMESMAPSSINVVSPPRPREADGLADRVYDQMRREFFVAGPFVLHGEVPELLAAAWMVVRETLFVGEADRGEKEAIAVAVSEANRCPFCVDAHTAALKAAQSEGRVEELSRWAAASGQEGHPELTPAPLDEHRAEMLGTLVAFHYLNRMVSAFLDEKMMPMPDAMNGATASMAKVMMGGMIRKSMANVPGASLELLDGVDPTLAWQPTWAAGTPHVAAALTRWSSAIETEAAARLSPELLHAVGDGIETWTDVAADPTPILGRVDEQVPDSLEAAGRAGTLAAIAPYRLTRADLDASHGEGLGTDDLLTLVSWASQRAARRVGEWTATAAG